MAYMNVVKGEMRSAFKSIKVCAEVLVRFPGICRYRFANCAIHPAVGPASLADSYGTSEPFRRLL